MAKKLADNKDEFDFSDIIETPNKREEFDFTDIVEPEKKNGAPNFPTSIKEATSGVQTPLVKPSPLVSNLKSTSETKPTTKQVNPFTAPIEEINKEYKQPSNLDLLTQINAKSQERVGVLKNRIGLLKGIKEFQAQVPQIEQEAADLSAVVQDPRQPLQVRQQAQEQLKLYQSQFDKFNQDVEAYKGLIDNEKKIVTDINDYENIRQKGLEKDWGFVKGLSEAIQSSTVKTLGGTAAMFNSLGLSGDPENPDTESNKRVQEEVRGNTDKINKFGESLVTQEVPKNFEQIFKGKFSTDKLKYILAQGLGQTAPTVAAGFLGGAGGAAITGAGLGFTESKDIFKNAGLSEKQSDVAALGLAIPLGLLEEWGVSDIVTKPIGKLIIKETTEDVIKNLAKKEVTNEVLFNTVKKTLGDKIKEYSIDVAKAAWKEPLTEMEQAALTEGAKQGAELYTGKDSNANQTMPEYLKETGLKIAEEGVYGLAGGAGMSAITSAFQNRTPISAYERALELKNPELLQDFTEQLDEEVASGRLTTEQANTALENVKKIQEVDNKIPSTVKGADRRSVAAALLTKKEELNQEIEGKDPILSEPIKQQVKEVDSKLLELTENKPIEEIINEPIKETETPITPSSSPSSEVSAPSDLEKDIQLSGLVDGFKATTFNSFDVRDNADVMDNISKEKSFVTKTNRKGKDYIVVGLKINEVKGNTVGRDGYSFATIEDNGNLPSNINELLTNKAKENASKLYPNVKNMTFKDMGSEVSAPNNVEKPKSPFDAVAKEEAKYKEKQQQDKDTAKNDIALIEANDEDVINKYFAKSGYKEVGSNPTDTRLKEKEGKFYRGNGASIIIKGTKKQVALDTANNIATKKLQSLPQTRVEEIVKEFEAEKAKANNEPTTSKSNIPSSNKGTQGAEPTKQESEAKVEAEPKENVPPVVKQTTTDAGGVKTPSVSNNPKTNETEKTEISKAEPSSETKSSEGSEEKSKEVIQKDNLVQSIASFNKSISSKKGGTNKGRTNAQKNEYSRIKNVAEKLGLKFNETADGKIEVLNEKGKKITKTRSVEVVEEPTQEALDNFKKLFKNGVITPQIESSILEPTQIKDLINAYRNGKITKDAKRLINELADINEESVVRYKEYTGTNWVYFEVPLSEMINEEVSIENLSKEEINQLSDMFDETFGNIDEETHNKLNDIFNENENEQRNEGKNNVSPSSSKEKGISKEVNPKVVKTIEQVLAKEVSESGELSKSATTRKNKRETALKEVTENLDAKDKVAVEHIVKNLDLIRQKLLDARLIESIDCKWAKK